MSPNEDFISKNAEEIQRTLPLPAAHGIFKSLQQHYYAGTPEVASSPHLHGDILANLMRRQAAFQNYLIPWVNIRRPLKDAVVVDIGCGTGSSTAAFAQAAKQVQGYEIAAGPASVAADRCAALSLGNARITHLEPDQTIKHLRADFPKGVDVIALIAVLEHMTEQERIDFLPAIWEYMRPGDILVVSELPNRLTYNDDHTAQMPFFHMLPLQMKTKYVDRSPRLGFVNNINSLAKGSRDTLELSLARWGIGLSFHDFEVGLGVDDLSTVMLADGFEHSTLTWWPTTVEETVLMDYFIRKPVRKPLGFSRSVLNFIFVKPYANANGVMLKHSSEHIRNVFKADAYPTGALERMLTPGTVG